MSEPYTLPRQYLDHYHVWAIHSALALLTRKDTGRPVCLLILAGDDAGTTIPFTPFVAQALDRGVLRPMQFAACRHQIFEAFLMNPDPATSIEAAPSNPAYAPLSAQDQRINCLIEKHLFGKDWDVVDGRCVAGVSATGAPRRFTTSMDAAWLLVPLFQAAGYSIDLRGLVSGEMVDPLGLVVSCGQTGKVVFRENCLGVSMTRLIAIAALKILVKIQNPGEV